MTDEKDEGCRKHGNIYCTACSDEETVRALRRRVAELERRVEDLEQVEREARNVAQARRRVCRYRGKPKTDEWKWLRQKLCARTDVLVARFYPECGFAPVKEPDPDTVLRLAELERRALAVVEAKTAERSRAFAEVMAAIDALAAFLRGDG